MKQKLVLFIALALTLAQGAAAATASFTTHVGWMVDSTLTFTFNPNAVVRTPNLGEDLSLQGLEVISTLGYSVTVEGADMQMFSASILSASVSMTTGYITMSVKVIYSPTVEGAHQAALKVKNQSDETKHTIYLVGEATPEPVVVPVAGDVDGDGRVTIADVTVLIDYLLTGDSNSINPETADVDGDGKITVADITALIDIILGVPQSRLCTFLIVTMTDGTAQEYMIDEYSTVNIAKPDLLIQTGGQTQTFDLEQIAHLSYEERMVTFSNKLANDHLIEQYREILKTQQP